MSFASCYESNEFNLPEVADPFPVGTKIAIADPTAIAAATASGATLQLLTGLVAGTGQYILPVGTWVYTGVTQLSVQTPGQSILSAIMRVRYNGATVADADAGYNSPGADLSLTPQVSAVIVSNGAATLTVDLTCVIGGAAGSWVFSDGAGTTMTQTLVRVH